MDVWVIETGEYENSGVFGVASSRKAGIEYVKEVYGPPYIIEWDEYMGGLRGKFQQVPGYSTQHTAFLTFTEYEIRNPVL